ncbi:MAG: hypothetical protein ACAI44_03620 [Candidatus Sericytochromatia bacterium]
MEYTLRFSRPSSVANLDDQTHVFLAAALQARAASPEIFTGQPANPLVFRNLLLSLHDVVEARYYRPDLWRYLDPVLTAGSEQLHLECFSSCGSVYGRVDFDSDAFAEARFHRSGTTNVDFHAAFTGHLASLMPGRKVQLEMGQESVALSSEAGTTIERKVKLPERWMRGFLNVQALHRRARQRLELDALSARQLILAVPAKAPDPAYIVLGRGAPQILSRPPAQQDALCVSGLQRLRLLKRILPDIKSIGVFEIADVQASVWVVQTAHGRLVLGLSSSVKHGFSGDGDALRQLTVHLPELEIEDARRAAEILNRFSAVELAEYLDLGLADTYERLDTLSRQGLLGYDVQNDSYFYRVLPFVAADPGRLSRLKGSQAILDAAGVEIESLARDGKRLRASGFVKGVGALYTTALEVDETGYLAQGTCNCQWIGKHGLQRGPCKHMLALRFAAEAACARRENICLDLADAQS